MYKTRIRSLYPGGAIDCSGKKLSFIGNLNVQEGDEVWTDGNVIYGNEHVRGESFIPAPESEAIPVRATGFIGFVNERGRLKTAGITDDAYILNGKSDFFHGSEERTIDAEVARDKEDNEIGVYTAVYNKAETTGAIQIKLNDKAVETIDLDDYKDEQIVSAKESATVEAENIECLQFHLNSDGSWEMLLCETAVLKEEIVPSGKPPDYLMVGNKPYNDDMRERIKAYTHDNTFGDIIYSRQAYLLDGSDNVEDNLRASDSPLARDAEVVEKVIDRAKAYARIVPDDESAIADYDTLYISQPRLWMKIQYYAKYNLWANQYCPNCGHPMWIKDGDQPGISHWICYCIPVDDTPGCGHEELFESDLHGGGLRIRFDKFDSTSPNDMCRYHKFYKLYKVTSDGERELLDNHESTPAINDWLLSSQIENTANTHQIKQYDSLGSDYRLYYCATPINGGPIVTIEFLAGLKSNVKSYLVFPSASTRFWRPYQQISYPRSYEMELTDSWEWNLNDGYVAKVNQFKVIEIRNPYGEKICGTLPFQFNQEDMPLLSLPYDDNNDEPSDDKNIIYFADGNTDYEKNPSLGYRNYSYNTSLSVQKLKNGYLIAFHGYKLYQVDNEGTITEIGDDTRNTRLNFIKKASKARR